MGKLLEADDVIQTADKFIEAINRKKLEAEDSRMLCADCGALMVLRKSSKYTYRNGKPRVFFGCSRFPQCNGSLGAHPDGTPVGIPVREDVKKLRRTLHEVLEDLWGANGRGRKAILNSMYEWMEDNLDRGHIGHMNEQECVSTLRLLLPKVIEAERADLQEVILKALEEYAGSKSST